MAAARRQPGTHALAERAAGSTLATEIARIVAGRSTLAPANGDRRFADPAWSSNKLFRGVLQSYVALGTALERCVTYVVER